MRFSQPLLSHRASGRRLLILMLGMMGVASFLGSDVYLPALPDIGIVMHHTTHAMQFTLGIYLLGLSVGQVILGPLSDAYGRRHVVLWSMVLFLLASLSCAVSVSYNQLLLSRLFQAFGASAGLVLGRAIIRDLYDEKEAGRVIATIFPFMGASPALSPLIGGFLSHYFGWRSTFLLVTLFALAILVLVLCFFHESLNPSHRQSWSFRGILNNYPKVILKKAFWFYAIAPCTSYLAFFAYMSETPFIFHHHGFTDKEIGFLYLNLSATYIVGNFVARHLLKKHKLVTLLRVGYCFFSVGAFMLFATSSVGFSVLAMMISTSLLTFGNGFLMPLGTTGAVSSVTQYVGYASGLLGFIQLGVASLSSSVIGIVSYDSLFRMSLYILCVAVVGVLAHAMLSFKRS